MWYARSGHCRGQDAPDSRKDALCWRKPLRVVRPVAVRVLHLLPVVHDEGRDTDQERRGETKYLAHREGALRVKWQRATNVDALCIFNS